MLEATLVALATAGGTAAVAAMGTDAWAAARGAFSRLFNRDGAPRGATVEAQLDDDAAIVATSDETDLDRVREELVPVWRRRFLRLLTEHPDAEAELREAIAETQAAIPPDRQAWIQTNVASGGTLFAVQGGNQEINYGNATNRERQAGS